MILTPMVIADTPTPAPSCSVYNQEATVTKPVDEPTPEGSSDLRHCISAGDAISRGKLVGQYIQMSSHDVWYMIWPRCAPPESPVSAARRIVNCVPTTGSYIFLCRVSPDRTVMQDAITLTAPVGVRMIHTDGDRRCADAQHA